MRNDSRNLYQKAPVHGVRAAYSDSDFMSHEVAALGKPRLERSGGLGQAGNQIVTALKGRARGDSLIAQASLARPAHGFGDVLIP